MPNLCLRLTIIKEKIKEDSESCLLFLFEIMPHQALCSRFLRSRLIRKSKRRRNGIICLIGKVSFSFVSFKKCRNRNKVVSNEANRAAEERECRRWRISVELFRSFFIFIDCHYNHRQVFKSSAKRFIVTMNLHLQFIHFD